MRPAPTLARTLRRNPTWAEKQLWSLLRDRRFAAFKFRRQHSFGPYVLDFYCPVAKLDVELDGDPHGVPAQEQHDAQRNEYLGKQGIRVLRFWNIDLLENQEGVLTSILVELEKRTARNPHPDPFPYTTRERGNDGPKRLIPVSSPPSCGGED